MIGRVINYDDNTDAYGIIGIDNNIYYGFEYSTKNNLVIGDTITFDYKVIGRDEYRTRVAINIKPYNRDFTIKLVQKNRENF